MPGVLLHVGAVVQCTHAAPASTTPVQTRVLVSSQPVATTANVFTVAGCLFTLPGPKPSPCVRVQWTMPATRVLVMGVPALLQTPPGPGPGAGLCLSPEQLPQGPPVVTAVQPRVLGV
jgi:hypothetical protein